MVELPISELALGDVRSVAVVSIDGQPVRGVLHQLSVWAHDDRKRESDPKDDWYQAVLVVGEAQLKTGHLPPDFLVQVERPLSTDLNGGDTE